MSRSLLRDVLSKLSDTTAPPRINVSLTDGNRLNLNAWGLTGDCLIERWPSGSPRRLVLLAQIVTIEIPDES